MIDERKLLEEIEKWKNTVTVNTYQDEILQLCIDVFRKKVESQPKINQWIPCSDRLPEDRKEKIVYLSSNRITIAKYNEHILPHSGLPIGWGYMFKNGYIDFEKETVLAWKPLPEPYKPHPAAGNETNWKESMMKRFTKGD